MAYRPILEIVAEEDLFTKESLSFLAKDVEITYDGDIDTYDLKPYYESFMSAIDYPEGYFELTPRFIHIVGVRPDSYPISPYILFEALILHLKPKKSFKLYLHADPDKSSNEEFGLPEDYSLPFYKLSFDGASANYEDTDNIINSIEGYLDIDGMYAYDENGEEQLVADVSDDWCELCEW